VSPMDRKWWRALWREGVAPRYRGEKCDFCRDDVWGYYMVHDEVWAAAGLHRRAHCCLRCLEYRLGRPLEVGDFPAGVPINRMVYVGAGRQSEFDRAQGFARQLRFDWLAEKDSKPES